MYSSKLDHVSNQKSNTPFSNSRKQSSFFKPTIQPKLTINQPNDNYEQEADAMADRVMRMPGTSADEPFFKPRPLSIQKKCAACEEGEKDSDIQMKPANGLIQREEKEGVLDDEPETKPFQLNVPFTTKMNYLRIVDELSAREVPFTSSYYRESSEEYLRQYQFYKSLGLGKIAQKAGTVPFLKLFIPDLPGIDPDAALANITTSISVGNALKRDYRLTTERDDTNIRIFNIKTWHFGGGSKIRRKCAHCEEEEKLHRKGNGNGEVEAGNELTNYIGNINSGGTELPEQVRSFFEPRFGYDFSNVRIHKDSVAAKSAQSINALAYTSGKNIVFNQNQYSPETDSGKKLLAHELTHVVQQINSGNNSLISRAVKECEPDHVLTWADYSGAIPRGATVGAITLSGVQKVMDNGKPKFQGILDSAGSWALEKHKSASDNTKNGCQQQIDQCKTFVRNNPRRLPGRTSPLRSGACPASVAPQAVEFRNEAECTSKVGAECKRAIVADSALLLKHEKLHFEISCIIAKKGNIEIAKGIDFDKVGEKVTDFQTKININNGSGQGDYDEESKHRCVQAKQDEWNTKVRNSLPGVVLS